MHLPVIISVSRTTDFNNLVVVRVDAVGASSRPLFYVGEGSFTLGFASLLAVFISPPNYLGFILIQY